jgi:hypothetical protein
MAYNSRIWNQLEKSQLELLRWLVQYGKDGAVVTSENPHFDKGRGQSLTEWLRLPLELAVIERVTKGDSVRQVMLRITAAGEDVITYDDLHPK